MVSMRNLLGAVLAVVAASALARSPYEIHGLHTELIFTEAVAMAEKLGGTCQITTSRSPAGRRNARCDFAHCSTQNQAGTCEPDTRGLAIAAQPILRISMEAPGESARLTLIAILFEGSLDAVTASLQQEFGPPDNAGTAAGQQSWTPARRLNWTRGHDRLGLLDSPKMIILGADRAPK
jgi:hypothetical protein